jgi:hypothetical protein
MKRLVRATALLAAFVLGGAAVAYGQAAAPAPAPAAAPAALDMKGGWSGTGKAIVEGMAAHHPAGDPAKSVGSARLREVTFTYKIDGQDGGRFWGTMSSPYRVEPVIGVIAADGKRIYIVAQDGFVDGVVVDNDTIDTCYRQRQPGSAVAACNLIKRKK